MANTAELLREAVRQEIGDTEDVERFPDDKLDIFIDSALKRLSDKIALTITISAGEFSAAPTNAQYNLIKLQTCCLIGKREYYDAVRKGVRIKQDENAVDTAANLQGFKEALDGEGGICWLLEKEIEEYLENNPDIATESVAGKYAENIWHGNRKIYEDVDHDGQGSERIYYPRTDSFIKRENETGTHDPDRFTTG